MTLRALEAWADQHRDVCNESQITSLGRLSISLVVFAFVFNQSLNEQSGCTHLNSVNASSRRGISSKHSARFLFPSPPYVYASCSASENETFPEGRKINEKRSEKSSELLIKSVKKLKQNKQRAWFIAQREHRFGLCGWKALCSLIHSDSRSMMCTEWTA